MKWLADVLAFLVAVVTFFILAPGTNPLAVAISVALSVATSLFPLRRVQHSLDRIDYVTKGRR